MDGVSSSEPSGGDYTVLYDGGGGAEGQEGQENRRESYEPKPKVRTSPRPFLFLHLPIPAVDVLLRFWSIFF